MAAVNLHHNEQAVVIEHQFLEGRLQRLPERVQAEFRAKIEQVGEQISYYFAHGNTTDVENRQRITREYFVLTTPTQDFLPRPDLNSPLYTRVELEPVIEEVEQEEPEAIEEIVREPVTIFSVLSEIATKIRDLMMEIFMSLRRICLCGQI